MFNLKRLHASMKMSHCERKYSPGYCHIVCTWKTTYQQMKKVYWQKSQRKCDYQDICCISARVSKPSSKQGLRGPYWGILLAKMVNQGIYSSYYRISPPSYVTSVVICNTHKKKFSIYCYQRITVWNNQCLTCRWFQHQRNLQWFSMWVFTLV